MTYMAPEIKLGEQYDGKQVDIFALGVILFIIVVGLFPFQEAHLKDYFYNMVHKGDHEKYWKKVARELDLSTDFKNLIVQMFSFEGSKRPTISEIEAHPWFNNNGCVLNCEKVRCYLAQ